MAWYVLMQIVLANNVSNPILRTPVGDDLLISAELLSNRVACHGCDALFWLSLSKIDAR